MVNSFLGIFEKIFFEPFSKYHEVDITPIFIVGPPRSGTTIIAQWFIHFINQPKTYISRIADLYPDSVLLLNAIFGKRSKIALIESESRYGQIKGLNAMAEGNRLWPWYVDSLTEEDTKKFIHTYNRTQYSLNKEITPDVISFLETVLKKQCYFHQCDLLINKSTHNATKIDALKLIFPRAKFIAVIRDGRYVARSLMKARKDLLGDESIWWNIKPSNHEKIKHLPPHLSCGLQWSGLLDDIEKQFNNLNENDYTYINYSDFIINPQQSLNVIYEKFNLAFTLNNDYNYTLKSPQQKSELFEESILKELEMEIGDSLEKWGFQKWMD